MKDLPSKEKKKSFEKPPKVKKEKPPKQSKHSKAEIPDDQKLTAFQERYLEDATLLFEFVENPNVRFLLPKDAICEVLPASTMINAENGNNSDNRDILMSFIWIHNQKEVDEYEKKLEEYNKKKAEEEEKKRQKEKEEEEEKERRNKEQLEKEKSNEKNKEGDELKLVQSLDEVQEGQSKDVEMGDNTTNTVKSEIEVIEISEDVQATEEPEEIKQEIEEIEETEEIEEIEEIVPAKRRAPPRRGKKKRRVPPPKKPTTPKPLEPPVEPEYRFTTLSFTIHGIPSKLVPIFMNSVNPIKEVQTKMKHILEVGTRTSSFYLWYQVDGKLDEELAENIRVLLNQEEKKMTGIPTIQHETPPEPKKYPKKRKIKEESKTGNEQGDDDSHDNNNNNNNSKKMKVESIEDNDEQNEGNKSENDSKVRDESNELVLKDHDNDESQPQNEDVKEAPVATDTVDSLISDQIEQTPESIKENSST